MNVEVCSNSIESVIIANNAGADRIELCSGLSVGGLSPSKGLIKLALKKSKIPIHCLIRPREGHFIYNKNDFETILYDVRYMKKMGVAGIVVGMINEDHDVNSEQLNEVIKEASGLEITFHRAFDCLKDPKKNILKLSSMGVSRILTSGRSKSAITGINNLIKWKLLSNNFAIKEAFSKSLGLGFRAPCFPKDISVQRDKMGKPEIFPKNELEEYMKEKFGNFLIHVSLSDTKKYSIASVIIEKT